MSLRLMLRRAAPALAASAAAACLLPSPALATAPTLSFGVSSTQAGGNPTLTADIVFNANSGDSPKDVTIALAPGVLANAAAAGSCLTTANLTQGGPCQIGTDTINGSLTGDTVYIVPPPSGVPGALAGVTTATLNGFGAQPGAVVIRNTPGDVGLDIVFSNLPHPIAITELSLTLNPTLQGLPFTRVPANCATATNYLSVDYWGSTPAASNVTSAFTPTGCPLPFGPSLQATATAVQQSGGYGVNLTGTVSFSSPFTNGTTNAVTLTLPSSISPNLAAVSNECLASNPATCPTADPASIVGAVTAVAAVLPSSEALTGDVVLTKPASGLYPGLAIVITKAGSITLPSPVVFNGSTNLTGSGFSASFTGIPDIPLSTLTMSLNSSALTTTCSSTSGTLTGAFADQIGTHASQTPNVTINGCPTVGGPTPGKPVLSGGTISGLSKGKPKLSFRLAAGQNAPKLSSFSIALPKGLSFIAKTLAKGLSVSGATIRSAALKGGKLVVALKSPAQAFKVTLSLKSLKVSKSIAKAIKKHKVKSLRATITVRDASGKSTSLKLKLSKLS